MCADRDALAQHLKNTNNAISNSDEALSHQVPPPQALTSVSRLNCTKLIQKCDRELAMIESEFDLLARKDFVEFVYQGCRGVA